MWHKTSRHERGYDSNWVKLREVILARDNYLCVPCALKGKTTPAREVDHIIPKGDGGTDEDTNLQSICIQCHKAKTILDNGGTLKGCNEEGIPIGGWA